LNNFLLTFSVPDPNGFGRIETYKWFESEEELHNFIIEGKELYPCGFIINEAIEIFDSRKIFE